MSSTHDQTWLNYTFPQAGWTGGYNVSPGYTPAMAFTVAHDNYVDKLAWYRHTTSGTKPTRLGLWRVDTLTEIGAITSVVDDGTEGWQDSALATPVAVYAGVRYKVAAYTPSGGPDWGCVVSSTPTSGGGMAFAPVITGYKPTGTYGYPNVDDTNTFIRYLDVHLTNTTPPAASTLTITDVDNDLKTWLSATSETNQHHDDLPWTTKSVLDGLVTSYNDMVAGLGTGAHSYYGDLKGLIANIKTVTDDLPTPINHLTSIVLDHYTADINNILSTLDSVQAGANAGAGGATFSRDVLAGRSLFPGGTEQTTWSMVEQTDFDTALAWTVPADLYVLDVTDFPARVSRRDFAGLTQVYRLGAWTVLSGTIGSTKRQIDFTRQLLEDAGRRMPGLAVRCQPGTIGTVQAWTLAPTGG